MNVIDKKPIIGVVIIIVLGFATMVVLASLNKKQTISYEERNKQVEQKAVEGDSK